MTEAEIAAFTELNDKRTPGEWRVGRSAAHGWQRMVELGSARTDQPRAMVWCSSIKTDPAYDAAFIAACSVYVPKLLAEVKRLREALEAARHSLVTLHGLTAYDGEADTYDEALANGADHSGAWDRFQDKTFLIDEGKAIAQIDEALGEIARKALGGGND